MNWCRRCGMRYLWHNVVPVRTLSRRCRFVPVLCHLEHTSCELETLTPLIVAGESLRKALVVHQLRDLFNTISFPCIHGRYIGTILKRPIFRFYRPKLIHHTCYVANPYRMLHSYSRQRCCRRTAAAINMYFNTG